MIHFRFQNKALFPISKSVKGFSLAEITVVMVILAVMSVSAVVGFGSLGDTIKVREGAGVVSDTLHQLTLEILTSEYSKTTVYFESDYLVAVSEPKDSTLALEWEGLGGSCASTEEQVSAPTDSGSLIKKDKDGGGLEITTVNAPETACVAFTDSAEAVWQYQLVSGGTVSDVIRFIHFNVDRKTPTGLAIEDNDYRLVVEGPYAKRTVYNGVSLVSGPAEITLRDVNDSTSEVLNLNP